MTVVLVLLTPLTVRRCVGLRKRRVVLAASRNRGGELTEEEKRAHRGKEDDGRVGEVGREKRLANEELEQS